MYAVCKWVIDELGFIGKEMAARSLEMYWRDRDILVLNEILDCARFPDEMSGPPNN